MTETLRGPAGFDEARKEPERWESCRTKGGWFAFRGGWETWRYDELTRPDTEWRRIPGEPMRFEHTQPLSYERDVHRGIVTGNGLLVKVHCVPGSKWDGKSAHIIVEEVTDAKTDNAPAQISDADQCCHRCGEDPCLTISRPLCMSCDDIVAREEKEQPDPPAEMTAEQAMKWLRANTAGCVMLVDKDGCYWFRSGSRFANSIGGYDGALQQKWAPYTPLAPVTRGQMAKIERLRAANLDLCNEHRAEVERIAALEKCIERLRSAHGTAENLLLWLSEGAKLDVVLLAAAVLRELREATKEGAGDAEISR